MNTRTVPKSCESFLSFPLTIIMTELDKRYVLDQSPQRYLFTIAGISGSCEILEEGIVFAYHLARIDL